MKKFVEVVLIILAVILLAVVLDFLAIRVLGIPIRTGTFGPIIAGLAAAYYLQKRRSKK